MVRIWRLLSAALSICLMLGGCTEQPVSVRPTVSTFQPVGSIVPTPSQCVPETPQQVPEDASESEREASGDYLGALVSQTIERFSIPRMTEYERAKAAFDYMIENTVIGEPIGLDLWRLHEDGAPLSFVENRSLSVLQYGVGMCEDYAAALTLLLRGLGLQAEYVPGLTYSLEGHLVDHAWTMARIDGVWYHLDCQLEDNISRHGAVRYRYFMRGDESISVSHLWGQRLIDSGLLSADQNDEIAESFLGEYCSSDAPKPERHTFTEQPAPDLDALRVQAESEMAAYQAEHGELPPLKLNIIPPVFGSEGYGPANEG